ncbi:outer membrane protein transport protein [Piscirickettsia litoralis]|uniref:outer membrane protein transport protein n=1 Tax=Piscirickettsia litoralis TaxID=1891921 RepID=UPI00228552D2|nr:outer membrane protein transport protein [Piscirickettsia litoralis]
MSLFVRLKKNYLFFYIIFLFLIVFQIDFAVPVQYLTNSYLVGNAFSGATTSPTIAVIDSNPAVLATLSAPELYMSDSYIRSQTNNDQAVATQSISSAFFGTTEHQVTGQTSARNTMSNQVPSFSVVWPASSTVSLGLAVTAGNGLNSEYDDQWVGRYLNTQMKLTTLNMTPMMAIKVTPKFSLGFGWHFQKKQI